MSRVNPNYKNNRSRRVLAALGYTENGGYPCYVLPADYFLTGRPAEEKRRGLDALQKLRERLR